MVIQELVTELGFNVDKSKLQKFEAGLNNVASKARVVSAGILAAGVAAVKFASDYTESMNKVDVAFGNAKSQVVDWSKTTLKQFGIARGTALDMVSLYGDMGTAMGQTKKDAADMGQQLVGRAADLASFKNISIDVANSALKGIFTGETESLKGLGIVMTQANLAQFALENGITKSIKKMSQAEQVNLRYAFVMEKSKNADGDFARTSDGVANQTRLVSEGMKEAAANIGLLLLPAVSKILKKVNSFIEVLVNLDEETQKNILFFSLLVAGIYPLIKAVQIGIAVTKGIIFMTKLWTTAQWVLNAALNANPIGLITIGILATIAAVALLIIYWDKVVAVFEEWGHVLKWLLGPLALMINLIVSVVKWWGLLRDSFQAGGIVGVLKEIGAGIFNFMIHPIRKFLEVFSMIPGVGKLAQGALDALNSARDFAEAGTVQGNARTMDTLNSKFGIGAGKATAQSGGSTQVTQNTTIQIPAGTPAAQQKFIQQDVAKVMREENQKAYRKTRRGAGRSE